MANPRDATIDIPLSSVLSRAGTRRADAFRSPAGTVFSAGSPNEKTGIFKQYVGGRRHKMSPQDAARHIHEEEDTLTKMGEIYNKVLDFSIVTRYFVYVLPLALMIAVPIVVGATVSQGATFGGVRIVWIFTWVEIVWLSLWISKLASKSLPFIFQFLCGIVSSGVRKYALVLKRLEIPLSLAGWALASLATFKPVRDVQLISDGHQDLRSQYFFLMNSSLTAMIVNDSQPRSKAHRSDHPNGLGEYYGQYPRRFYGICASLSWREILGSIDLNRLPSTTIRVQNKSFEA